MAFHNINPVREQLRGEILAALAKASAPMTTGDLYKVCPSAENSEDVSRLAWDLKRKGLIADGGKVDHPRGSPVNSYVLAITEDPRLAAARPIKADAKIKPTRQPAIKRKPAPGHPFAASIRPQEAHDSLPRVSRDLPIHLTTTAPTMAADSIRNYLEEEMMSEDPTEYIPDPDAFSLEPSEPEELDSDLVDALFALSQMDDVGEITEAMANRHESAPQKPCKCLKLPPLPKGYIYGGFKVWIESEHDFGTITLATVDDGGGAFIKCKSLGHLSFDSGDLVKIGQVADALIKLHESMDDNHE